LHCDRCGHENPAENYFCGHCGIPLERDDQPIEPLTRQKTPAAVAEGAPRQQDRWLDQDERPSASPANVSSQHQSSPAATVNGPSFLGLAESAEEDSGLQYLYDDQPRRHGLRWIITCLIVVALGVFLVYERARIPGWYAAIAEQTGRVTALVRAHLPGSIAGSAAASSSAPASAPEENQSTPAANGTAAGNNPALPASASPGNSAQPSDTSGSTGAAAATSSPSSEGTGNNEDTTKASPSQTSESATPVSRRRAAGNAVPNPGQLLLTKGQAYLYGNGVPRDCNQALTNLYKAADMGNAEARMQLGTLYATGHCVPLDRARAYNWFTLAANVTPEHNIWVERNRRMLWGKMTETEKAQTLGAPE
jgi:hypothetical protein